MWSGHSDHSAQAGQTIHPTQIYMSLNALVLFGVCRWLLPRRAFAGQVACIGWMLYAVGRSVVESFRGDTVRGHVGALSTSQFISIFICVLMFLFLRH